MDASYEPVKQSDNDDKRPTSAREAGFFRRPRLTAFALALGTLAVTLYYFCPPAPIGLTGYPSSGTYDFSHDNNTSRVPPMCAGTEPPPAEVLPSVWKNLDVFEAAQIRQWLVQDELGLNLTRGDLATISDNSIYLVEVYRPPKEATLAYLDSGAPAPDRFARVTLHHGAFAEPVVRDYLVGPLPLSEKSKLTQLTDIYHEPEIPYNARGFAKLDDMMSVVLAFMTPLEEATTELFGGAALGLPNDTLVASGYAPFSFDGSFRRAWLTWRRNVAGPWLHPLGFFQYVSMDGTDPSQWKVLKVVYNHQVFSSNEEFMDAFRNGTLKRAPFPEDKNPSWSSRQRRGPTRDLDDRAGPRSVNFNGPRYRVNVQEQYVSWMGWEMYFGFDRDMGLELWNIKFLKERIIYQLAPQEAIAVYAGNDPVQATTAWLDRYFGMGGSVRDLLPGYDCPYGAQYFPATIHTALGSSTQERAICVFEIDTGKPVTRHIGFVNNEFGAVKGYALTVRSISTVGNYDYLFDYTFYLDGTVEVRLSASGYLQGGYWDLEQQSYGSRINRQSMGSIHDHVINYKVDLDILGTANSLLETKTTVEEVTQPWFEDDWGSTVIQQRINHRYIETEDEALLKYPTNFQGGYAITNKNETNAWGSVRGYSIHAGANPIHATVVGSKRLLENANWARYNLAVSKRKETEPSSSSMWNINLPGKPTVNFHKFFDGDSLDQEDLVAWINVGTHHMPVAEDVPNTKTIVASSSFYLTPLNYFDYDVSIDSLNAVLIGVPEEAGGLYTFEEYGVRPEYCVPPELGPLTYDGGLEYGLDGNKADKKTAEELRQSSELFHRIKLEI